MEIPQYECLLWVGIFMLRIIYENNYFHLQPLKNNKFRIFKSRYDSIDSYLSSCGEKYNDIDLTIDEEIYKQLLDAGNVKEVI